MWKTTICLLSRIDDRYTDVSYSDGILTIKTDWTVKDIEAHIEITKEEIIQKVIDESIEPKEAICKLLTEKVFLSAREF